MANHTFFQNKDCAYFPCHKGVAEEEFNCLFCYCPLYALGDKCGGGFCYTKDGIKDCSCCVFPHKKENYALICARAETIVAQMKKETDNKP